MKKIIYKYTCWNEYTRDALMNKYFWFSKPTNFNDPFDNNMDILLAYEDTKRLFCYEDKTQHPPLDIPFAFIKRQTDNFGILCFTKPGKPGEPGDKGFNNLHFWSHYADSHKGVSLGFDLSKVESYYTEKIQCDADLEPVVYRTKPIDIDKDDIILETKSYGKRAKKLPGIFGPYSTEKDKDAFFKTLLLTKDSRIWGSENESRIIFGRLALENIINNKPFGCTPFHVINDQGYKIPYPEGDILREVTFGVKFPKSEIKNAIKLIHKYHKNVNYYKAKLDFVQGAIRRRKISPKASFS